MTTNNSSHLLSILKVIKGQKSATEMFDFINKHVHSMVSTYSSRPQACMCIRTILARQPQQTNFNEREVKLLNNYAMSFFEDVFRRLDEDRQCPVDLIIGNPKK